jgi:hypothetical protein
VGTYVKRSGLVASVPLGVDPDSTIFGNADAGTVKGAEVVLERDLRGGVGVRLAYTLQEAVATATDPFLLNRLIVVDPVTGDTTRPARAEFPLDYDRSTHRGPRPGTGPAPGAGVPPWPARGAVIGGLPPLLPDERGTATRSWGCPTPPGCPGPRRSIC